MMSPITAKETKARLAVLNAALVVSGCFTQLHTKPADGSSGSDGAREVAWIGDGPDAAIDRSTSAPDDGQAGLDGTGAGIDGAADIPVEAVCPSGRHSCGGKCVPDDDPSSCGSACTACAIPQGGTAICDGISCGGECPNGKVLCSGACIDQGTPCATACPDGTHACKGLCLSSSDVTGCGSSCLVCPVPSNAARATCDGSRCGFICSDGFHVCGDSCARDDDASACGASCTVCPKDANGVAACLAGICSVTCNPGFHYCSDAKKCLADADVASCGSSCTPCSSITGGVPTCKAGVCGGACPGTQKLCNGTCIDASAACADQCPSGTHNCSGICASDTSAATCGTSCAPCATPEGSASVTCTGGTCGFTCASGRHQCGSACAADDDATACGAACKKCPTDVNGVAICQNGNCSVRCNSGFHNCGGKCVSNGALETCGLTECTTPCQAPSGGTVDCNGTACVPSCPPSAPQNCNGTCIAQNAACNGTCPGGQKYCASGGICVATSACCNDTDCNVSTTFRTCNTSHVCGCSGATPKDCNGTCIATSACCSDADCDPGTTGKTCNASHQCGCSGATPTACNGKCVNSQTDGSNCGACGHACLTGATCQSGGCVCQVNAPKVNISPSSQTACSGESPSISVSASLGSGAGFTYQWYKTGQSAPLANGTDFAGVATPTLTVKSAKSTNFSTDKYYCVVTDVGCGGSTNSATSGLEILDSPTVSGIQNASAFVGPYGLYLFEVTVSGGLGPYSFQWFRKDGTLGPLANDEGGGTFHFREAADCSDTGDYYGVVTDSNHCQARTNTATLQMTCTDTGPSCSATVGCP